MNTIPVVKRALLRSIMETVLAKPLPLGLADCVAEKPTRADDNESLLKTKDSSGRSRDALCFLRNFNFWETWWEVMERVKAAPWFFFFRLETHGRVKPFRFFLPPI